MRIPFWVLVLGWFLSAGARTVCAIGWDSNDFLVTGGNIFPDRIAVFDFDLSFKDEEKGVTLTFSIFRPQSRYHPQ
jgi:hypothetical protein